jgi:hypothetical protein
VPSLDDILHDMLMVIANGDTLDGVTGGDPTHITPPKPSPTTASPIATGPSNQSIWYWEKAPNGANASDPGYLGQVTHVNCWARWMANMHQDDTLGWMTVCDSVTWSPVKIEVKRGNTPYKLTLPLTEKYVVKTVFLGGGQNPGKGWWPLPADVDNSFFQVFVYDITGKTSSDDPDPVPQDVYTHDDFMPDPGQGSLPAPALNPGETVQLTAAHKHYVCVVMSLVCCKERADFEPGALVGVARMVPHFMVMTNMPVEGIEASVRIERPEESGYHGTSNEPGRPPMHHHDMDPPIKALVAADTNVTRPVDVLGLAPLPFWDIIFDYVIPAPDENLIKIGNDLKVVKDEPQKRTILRAIDLLDYARVSKAVRGGAGPGAVAAAGLMLFPTTVMLAPSGPGLASQGAATAVGAEGGSALFTRPGLRIVHRDASSRLLSGAAEKLYGTAGLRKQDLLPRVKADVVKWPRQGQFDSIHLAPRMKADLMLARPALSRIPWADTLQEIAMAPFCEHDCFHTHFRWGANWNEMPTSLALKNGQGISGFSGTATTGKFGGVGVPNTEIGAPLVPLNQEISVSFESEHVFNYTATMAKDIVPGVWQAVFHHGSAYAVSLVADKMVKFIMQLVTGCILDFLLEPEWSEFYWTLRYQDTADGPLERIEVSDTGLRWLMGA